MASVIFGTLDMELMILSTWDLRQKNFYVMRGHPLWRPPVFYLEQILMLLFKRHV